MKKHLNLALLALWAGTTLFCVVNWLHFLDLPGFVLPVVPAFCSQLLMCRLTRNGWLRALPALPVPIMLGIAAYFLIWGSGWDMLAALLFGFGAIAPAVGVGAGWGVWALCLWREKRQAQ